VRGTFTNKRQDKLTITSKSIICYGNNSGYRNKIELKDTRSVMIFKQLLNLPAIVVSSKYSSVLDIAFPVDDMSEARQNEQIIKDEILKL